MKHKRFKNAPKYNPAAERVRQRATWMEQVRPPSLTGEHASASLPQGTKCVSPPTRTHFHSLLHQDVHMRRAPSLVPGNEEDSSFSTRKTAPSEGLGPTLNPEPETLSLELDILPPDPETRKTKQVVAEEQNKPLELRSDTYKDIMLKEQARSQATHPPLGIWEIIPRFPSPWSSAQTRTRKPCSGNSHASDPPSPPRDLGESPTTCGTRLGWEHEQPLFVES